MKRMSPGPRVVSSPDEVTRLLEHWPGGGAQLHTHFSGHEHGERRLPETGRAEEEGVVERLAPAPCRVHGNLERRLDLLLSDEFVETGGPERGLGAGLLGEGVWCGDFEAFGHRGRAAG